MQVIPQRFATTDSNMQDAVGAVGAAWRTGAGSHLLAYAGAGASRIDPLPKLKIATGEVKKTQKRIYFWSRTNL
jgi:hypothetical protein